MIFLLDSWATSPVWWKKFKILTLARARKSIAFRAEYFWLNVRNKIAHIIRRPTSASNPSGATAPNLDDINHPIGDVPWEIWEKIYRNAKKKYPLLPLGSCAVLFRAQDNNNAAYLYPVYANLGWDGLFKQGLRRVEIPGDHLSLLKDSPAITLAGQLKEYLKELSDSRQVCVNSLPQKEDKPAPFLH